MGSPGKTEPSRDGESKEMGDPSDLKPASRDKASPARLLTADDHALLRAGTSALEEGSATRTPVAFTFDAGEPDSAFRRRVYPSDQMMPAFGTRSDAGIHAENSLPGGTYTFEVRTTDVAGNPDPTPGCLRSPS